MSRRRTLLPMIVLLSWLPTSALPYFFAGSPQCPWTKPDNTWAKFMSWAYGGNEPFFSIRFTRHIGDLEGGQCYSISYLGRQNWNAMGKLRNERNYKSKSENRHGGDPAAMKINVWGAMFTYNEAGEVFYDKDGQLAGILYCHVGSECWK